MHSLQRRFAAKLAICLLITEWPEGKPCGGSGAQRDARQMLPYKHCATGRGARKASAAMRRGVRASRWLLLTGRLNSHLDEPSLVADFAFFTARLSPLAATREVRSAWSVSWLYPFSRRLHSSLSHNPSAQPLLHPPISGTQSVPCNKRCTSVLDRCVELSKQRARTDPNISSCPALPQPIRRPLRCPASRQAQGPSTLASGIPVEPFGGLAKLAFRNRKVARPALSAELDRVASC